MSRANRLIAAATVVLAVAAVVVLHNSFAPRTDTCADPDRLRSLSVFDGANELNLYIDQQRDQPLWVDGTIAGAALEDPPYTFRFIRSYDIARFLQAGLLLLRNFPLPLDTNEHRILDIDGEPVPVQIRIRLTGNAPYVTGYLVAIGNDPVKGPALGALRRIFEAPLRGPEPITILLVESPRPRTGRAEQEAFILEWLETGWREFRAACVPRS